MHFGKYRLGFGWEGKERLANVIGVNFCEVQIMLPLLPLLPILYLLHLIQQLLLQRNLLCSKLGQMILYLLRVPVVVATVLLQRLYHFYFVFTLLLVVVRLNCFMWYNILSYICIIIKTFYCMQIF